MKKVLNGIMAALLAGMSSSALAWWGPGWGGPGWNRGGWDDDWLGDLWGDAYFDRCQPGKAKRRLVVPGSREAILETRRAVG
ncbi:MAG: hypothetical protein ABW068_09570, partial [Candidatus Thiodiazotropha sp.]